MEKITLNEYLKQGSVVENLKNFVGVTPENTVGLMTPERLAAVAGESIGTNLGIVSFKKFNFSGENPHELTLPKKGKMYRVTVYSTSLYHKFGLFYCIFQSNVARAVHKIFSSSLTLELNGETGVITITNAMNCIVFVEELA